jgi:hypothetical protein
MSITIALPPEKEKQLREIYGDDENIASVFQRLLDTLIDVMPRTTPLKQRIPGLSQGPEGSFYMSEDFDEPLPDSFWFGEE